MHDTLSNNIRTRNFKVIYHEHAFNIQNEPEVFTLKTDLRGQRNYCIDI